MRIKTPLFYFKVDILFIIVMFIFFLSSRVRGFLSSFFVCYLFILFHEASHMFVAVMFGRNIDTFSISLFGVNVSFEETHYDTSSKEIKKVKKYIENILIYLVGPISNFILAIIFYKIKLIFDINIFLGILNLVPIYPLDGYNIFKNIMSFFKFEKNKLEKTINIVNYIFFTILFILGILILTLSYNPSLILFLLYLIIIKKCNRGSSKNIKCYK